MDITQFVDANTDQQIGTMLDDAGPRARRLWENLQNEEKTRSHVATAFWQAFLGSEYVFEAAASLRISPSAFLASEKIVVPRPVLYRFDLLVLVPGSIGSPRSTPVKPLATALSEGWYAAGRGEALPRKPNIRNNPDLALEALHAGQPFTIIVLSSPETEPLAVPSPSCPIMPGLSSAGIVAEDRLGRKGVTAALHAVGTARNITVAGSPGTVVANDQMSDSCFIELPIPLPPVGVAGQKGPLRGILPRGQQAATFEGQATPLGRTVITSWSPDAPDVKRYSQIKVYTKKDTNPGDSGAALITDDDFIAGFAFERSKLGAALDFSSWIWAVSVYDALELESA